MRYRFSNDDYAYCIHRYCLALDRMLDHRATSGAKRRACKWARAWVAKTSLLRNEVKFQRRIRFNEIYFYQMLMPNQRWMSAPR
jgi:hypothetical protein